MDYFNVRADLSGFLRAKFKSKSEADTQKLAKLFAPLARALYTKATLEEKLIIGLNSDSTNRGKSTFVKTFIPMSFDAAGVTETTLGHVFHDVNDIKLFQYDQRRIQTHELVESVMRGVLRKINKNGNTTSISSDSFEFKVLKAQSEIRVVEWIKDDIKNPEANMLWDFNKQPNNDREISLYCVDEILTLAEYEHFSDQASEFRIS
jgi:hypothetical protein